MLIESKYISQLHFYSTIVRDFLSLGNNNNCISIFEHLRFLKNALGPPGFILFSKTWRLCVQPPSFIKSSKLSNPIYSDPKSSRGAEPFEIYGQICSSRGLSSKIYIASMGHLRIQGGSSPEA